MPMHAVERSHFAELHNAELHNTEQHNAEQHNAEQQNAAEYRFVNPFFREWILRRT